MRYLHERGARHVNLAVQALVPVQLVRRLVEIPGEQLPDMSGAVQGALADQGSPEGDWYDHIQSTVTRGEYSLLLLLAKLLIHTIFNFKYNCHSHVYIHIIYLSLNSQLNFNIHVFLLLFVITI